MTREEAIRLLTTKRAQPSTDYQMAEAYTIAIKSLEHPEQNVIAVVPCGDAISRQAVLESIKNLYPDMPVMDIMGARRKWLEKYAPYFECENVVEHLPSVNPQPETAHWITTRTLMHDGEYYCDKCDCDAPNNKKWDYCPNCGRRMVDGPQQESEG